MAQWLKQSTAVTVKLGPFVDETDGHTEETALTIAQADIRLSKNGGDIASTNNVAGATHDEIGIYNVPLDATDTGTPGTLDVFVHEAGALPVWQRFMVVPGNVWDSLFGSDRLQVDVREAAAGLVTAALLADGAITASKLAADCITASTIAAGAIDAATFAAGAITSSAAPLLDAAVSSRASQASADLIAGYVDSEVAAIKAKTDALPANPAAASDIPSAAGNAAAVLAAVVEGTESLAECLRLLRAALVGKSDGFPAGPVHFRDAADTKNRITASVDSDGNRTSLSVDPS